MLERELSREIAAGAIEVWGGKSLCWRESFRGKRRAALREGGCGRRDGEGVGLSL